MGDIPKVRRGDKIKKALTAGTFNTIADGINELRRDRFGVQGAAVGGFDTSPTTIAVQRSADNVLDRYSVVGLDKPIFTDVTYAEFLNRVSFKAVPPTEAEHAERFAVVQEPMGKQAIGRAVVSGVTQVLLSVASTSDTVCGIDDAYPGRLRTGRGTTPIIWKESGTGDRVGIVRVGGRPTGPQFFRILSRTRLPPSADTARWKYKGRKVKFVTSDWQNMDDETEYVLFNEEEIDNDSLWRGGSAGTDGDMDDIVPTPFPIGKVTSAIPVTPTSPSSDEQRIVYFFNKAPSTKCELDAPMSGSGA